MVSKTLQLIKDCVHEKHNSIKIEALYESISSDNADSAGKAFEIHVAKHIMHALHGYQGDSEDHLPLYFSDDSGMSSREYLNKLKLGTRLNDRINRDARRMSHHILNHIKKYNKISFSKDDTKVTWTSKPKDLERLTGIKDIKGTSDIVISQNNTHHGISLKYSHTTKPPAIRSPGIEDLNTHLNADSDHINNILKLYYSTLDHIMKNHIGTGSKKDKHIKFKRLMTSRNQSEKIATENAIKLSKDTHKQISTHYSDSFNKLDHEKKSKFIRRMIDAEESSIITPYRAHYDGTKNTSKITNPTKEFNDIHKNVHHYVSEVSGATVNIHAVLHDGSRTRVCSFGIKNKGGSPYSGIGARVSDVFKSK